MSLAGEIKTVPLWPARCGQAGHDATGLGKITSFATLANGANAYPTGLPLQNRCIHFFSAFNHVVPTDSRRAAFRVP